MSVFYKCEAYIFHVPLISLRYLPERNILTQRLLLINFQHIMLTETLHKRGHTVLFHLNQILKDANQSMWTISGYLDPGGYVGDCPKNDMRDLLKMMQMVCISFFMVVLSKLI